MDIENEDETKQQYGVYAVQKKICTALIKERTSIHTNDYWIDHIIAYNLCQLSKHVYFIFERRECP